ncbi:MAG TPA: short-chain dehydrogenase [Alphaproteobacteria bacterium]|nr:short-chain dehydrogenase [Alphaproteobacteria bacterium]
MAVARAFARDGMAVALTRRARNLNHLETQALALTAQGHVARAFGVDAREEAEMVPLFDQIEREMGPLAVVVFNIGGNVRHPITETTAQVYTKVWEMAAFAGFLAGREAARVMAPRAQGTIIFTGATASTRGGNGFAAFAGAKTALRALAQSMARELGPKGIHVAHVVIDGAVEGEFIRSMLPDFEARRANNEVLNPDEIARNYVWLHHQHRSAWTHELDLRPWTEKW